MKTRNLLALLLLPIITFAQEKESYSKVFPDGVKLTIEETSFGQFVTKTEEGSYGAYSDNGSLANYGVFGIINTTSKLSGTPFLNNSFSEGLLMNEKGEAFKGVMAINLLDGKVYNQNLDVIADSFKSIQIFNQSYVSAEDLNAKCGRAVFQVIQDGNIEVLKKIEAKLSFNDFNSYTRFSGNTDGELVKKESYFFRMDGRYVPVTNKLSFTLDLNQYEEKALKLMESKDFNLKREHDILKFAQELQS